MDFTKIKQPEGLRHMWYRCDTCGVRERIWNSRPRVTPYCIQCRECHGEMTHVDWQLDSYDPNYQPKKGDRIFVDWSREAAEKVNREKIDMLWNHEEWRLKDQFETKSQALEMLMKTWTFGQPALEEI